MITKSSLLQRIKKLEHILAEQVNEYNACDEICALCQHKKQVDIGAMGIVSFCELKICSRFLPIEKMQQSDEATT